MVTQTNKQNQEFHFNLDFIPALKLRYYEFLSVSLFSYFYLNKEAKSQFNITMDLNI